MSPKERAADARERLLAAASELFYAEGVNTVGIDRVIERAGVAKATLYNAFGSKDELVKAYLNRRHDATMERMTTELERRFSSPKERLVGVFEVQGLSFTDPGFRGCAFVRSSAVSRPGTAVDEAASDYRTWIHTLFFDLAQQAGADTRGRRRNGRGRHERTSGGSVERERPGRRSAGSDVCGCEMGNAAFGGHCDHRPPQVIVTGRGRRRRQPGRGSGPSGPRR